MSSPRRAAVAAAAVAVAALALAASPAAARHRHHRPPVAAKLPASHFDGAGWQAEAVARATAAQQAAPGLTEELAPGAKQTATGGPVGGVPGFSGR